MATTTNRNNTQVDLWIPVDSDEWVPVPAPEQRGELWLPLPEEPALEPMPVEPARPAKANNNVLDLNTGKWTE